MVLYTHGPDSSKADLASHGLAWAQKTENRTEFTENRIEFTETEKFGSMLSSDFLSTEITEVFSVVDLGKPKYRVVTEFI